MDLIGDLVKEVAKTNFVLDTKNMVEEVAFDLFCINTELTLFETLARYSKCFRNNELNKKEIKKNEISKWKKRVWKRR